MAEYTKSQLTEMIAGKLQRNFGRTVDDATPHHMFKACAWSSGTSCPSGRSRPATRSGRTRSGRSTTCPWSSSWAAPWRRTPSTWACWAPSGTPWRAWASPPLTCSRWSPTPAWATAAWAAWPPATWTPWTTLEIPATGYSICYELGIFKQKIIDGQQVELADNWLGLGDAWLIPKLDETEEVRFGGKVEDEWDENGVNHPKQVGYTTVLAIPRDMEIAGYQTKHTNTPAPVGRQEPRPRGHVPVLPGRVPEGGGAAGHGRGHRQGPLPRRQPLRGQVPAPEAAVFLRLRHRAVHRAPAPGPVRHPA